jgi:parallel beta-helix repeat protein
MNKKEIFKHKKCFVYFAYIVFLFTLFHQYTLSQKMPTASGDIKKEARQGGHSNQRLESLFYAKLYSAVILENSQTQIDDPVEFVIAYGSVEFLEFEGSQGPLYHRRRYLIQAGTPGMGYPGFTVRIGETCKTAIISGSQPFDGKTFRKSLGGNFELYFHFPEVEHRPISATIELNDFKIAYSEIYETTEINNSYWPQLIITKFLTSGARIIQFYSYHEKPDAVELPDQPYVPVKNKSKVSSSILLNIENSQLEVPRPHLYRDTDLNDPGFIKPKISPISTGKEQVDFKAIWGLPSFDFDTNWLPSGNQEPGAFPLELRVAFGAGCNFSSEIEGEFKLDQKQKKLGVGNASGNLKLDLGAEFHALLCINTYLFEPFLLEIPWVPNFDLRCKKQTNFSNFLLDSKAVLSEHIIRDTIYDADLVQLLLNSLGISIPGLNGGVRFDASLEAGASMTALSLTTSDGLSFKKENQWLPVNLSWDSYSTTVNYNEEFRLNAILHLYPTIYFSFLSPDIYYWELEVADIPWTIFSQLIDLDFNDSTIHFVTEGIKVNYPDQTGITWETGKPYTITWDSTKNVGAKVKIDLYKGANRNRAITTSTPNDGSYTWTVPDDQTTGSDFKIKITSTSNSSYYDYSDNYFTIKPGEASSIEVTYPNTSGITWKPGNSYTITWDTTGNVGSNVKIELYKGSSRNYTITSYTSNDGSYTWKVPDSQNEGSNYRIKVTSTSNSSYYDYSDNYFTIKPDEASSIEVTYPNSSGITWEPGDSYNITWTSTGNVGSNVKIELYKGDSHDLTLTSSTSNDGSYTWKVPDSQNEGSNYRIKVTSTSNSSYYDYSDNYFTISSGETPSIKVTYPDASGITWKPGSIYTITWDSKGDIGSDVKIELYKGASINCTIDSSTPNDGSFTWRIPESQTTGTDFRVKITSLANSSYYDYSDNYFTIKSDGSSNITLTYPNSSGITWERGKNYEITWNSTGDIGTHVKIELYQGNAFNRAITSSTPDDSSFWWKIPDSQDSGSDFKIKITSTSNSSYYDYSDNYFTISSTSINHAPDKPILTGTSEVYVGQNCTFSVKIDDPDNDQLRVYFDYGDGNGHWTGYEHPSNYKDVYIYGGHNYSTSGTFKVKARSQDNYGVYSEWSDEHIIIVHETSNQAPNTPIISGPSTGTVNQTLVFSIYLNDPDGDDLGFKIKWGDGSSMWHGVQYKSGTTVDVEYEYYPEGTYTISCYAFDDLDAQSETAFHTITITKSNSQYPVYIRETGEGFNTIQEAIDAASNNQHIDVSEGTYKENISIYKNVSVVGENPNTTIIDCSDGYYGVMMYSDATLKNFKITGSGIANIYCYNSNPNIINNIITNSNLGIRHDYTTKALIKDNTIKNNSYGINCYGDCKSIITGNTITNNKNGIYIKDNSQPDIGGGGESSGGNVIKNNENHDITNYSPHTIYAKNNFWDHSTEEDIDKYDIYDDDENSSSGKVVFVPFQNSTASELQKKNSE